jgi:hypothetical protein
MRLDRIQARARRRRRQALIPYTYSDLAVFSGGKSSFHTKYFRAKLIMV